MADFFHFVMAGLVPAIHDFSFPSSVKAWMPATSAGVTEKSGAQEKKP